MIIRNSIFYKILLKFKEPRQLIKSLPHYFLHATRSLWSDKLYLKMLYRIRMGKPLNLNDPQTFTEKIQWLKLYNRKPEHTTMVDKNAVKDYVAKRIGEEYIIPTIGVWNRPEDIDFSTLPERFILKTTHGGGGGGISICRGKATFNKEEALAHLRQSLKQNIYSVYKEWPYKNVPHRIIAEEYVEDTTLKELRDYKFYCFNGKCRCFKVDYDRFIEHHANYYDLNCNILPFGETAFPPQYDKHIELPQNLNKMMELAEKLSEKEPFLRVDFYNVDGNIYFGELTFFPFSGLSKFTSEEWNKKLGEWIELPLK